MTDLQNTSVDNPEERIALRERAKLLGINHSPNISNALLRERINAKLNDTTEPEKTDDSANGPEQTPFEGNDSIQTMDSVDPDQIAARVVAAAQTPVSTRPLTKKQIDQAEREKQWAEQLRLVRVRITCLNPIKKDLKGEVISVSNQFLGTVRKFVPFGEATDNGYHIPFVLYTELLGRQFQSITVKKSGQTSLPDHRLVKEFAIERLPDLTPDEIAALARTQAVAANQ